LAHSLSRGRDTLLKLSVVVFAGVLEGSQPCQRTTGSMSSAPTGSAQVHPNTA
jgi:hypothetical protein